MVMYPLYIPQTITLDTSGMTPSLLAWLFSVRQTTAVSSDVQFMLFPSRSSLLTASLMYNSERIFVTCASY
jgi:hypothetical protein